MEQQWRSRPPQLISEREQRRLSPELRWVCALDDAANDAIMATAQQARSRQAVHASSNRSGYDFEQ